MDNMNNDKIIYCSKCGKKNSSYDKFCTNCGNKLKNVEDKVRETATEIKESITNNQTYQEFTSTSYGEESRADFNNKDMVNFVQKKVDYYIPAFKEIQELRKSTSWNWAAFFFNSWWFLYRKMYAYGFGIIVATFIVTALIPPSGFLLNIVIAIVSGLYGNIMYLKETEKQIQSVANMEPDLKQRILLSRGGVNVVIPIIFAILTIGTIVLVMGLGAFLFMFSSPYYY